MAKKEKIFPIDTTGGRLHSLRHKMGYLGDIGKEEFYDFLYSDEPNERNINKESKRKNVANWERSRNTLPIRVIKKVCEKCNCSPDYLLGIEKEVNHDLHFICGYTGLSETAVNALHMLHTLVDPSVANCRQSGRYDIIALNLILEDFYRNEKNKEDYKKFSTDTILDAIGKYVDMASARLDVAAPVVSQNNNTFIVSREKIAKESLKTDLYDLLEELREKYYVDIIKMKRETSDYFESIYRDYNRKHHNSND